MKAHLRNSEIYLILIGLLIFFIDIVWAALSGFNPWIAGGICVVLVGAIQWRVYWQLKQREQQARDEAISEIQHMLKDQINSQLTVIQSMSNLREVHQENSEQAHDYVTRSVNTISGALNELSAESLRRWQRRYRVEPTQESLPLDYPPTTEP